MVRGIQFSALSSSDADNVVPHFTPFFLFPVMCVGGQSAHFDQTFFFLS